MKTLFNNSSLVIKIIRRFFLTIIDLLLLPCYWLIRVFPRNKNLWIFGSWFGQRYSDNSRIFFEYVNKNHPNIKPVWLSSNKKLTQKLKDCGYNAVQAYSLKGFWYCLCARKAFSTSVNEFSLYFCHGIEFYSLWHGMPLKKINNDDTNSGGAKQTSKVVLLISKILRTIFPWRSFLNQKKLYTVTNSDFFVQFLKTAFSISADRILKTGSPRCDALFDNRKEKLIEIIHQTYPNSRIVLYMPTFRTGAWTGKIFEPFTEQYGFYNEQFIEILKKENIVFLYKPHFADEILLFDKKLNERFITITDEDFDELYNFIGQVDILATDYSSIYFDFIATNKPVILCPFDYEDYLKFSRDHYFDYFQNIEGVKANNWGEFLDIIINKTYYTVSEEKRQKFAEFLDGQCCKKLFEEVRK